MEQIFSQILPALRATLALAVLTGLISPFVITSIAQILFPFEANGSFLVDKQGKQIGSLLIAQSFNRPRYFHPRPSAAGLGYAAEMSSGSNLGPTSAKLINGQPDDPSTKNVDESYLGIEQLVKRYRQENLLADGTKVPVDAVTRSGSGLDPHISVANAALQIRRVAMARNLTTDAVLHLVHSQTEDRQFGILGEPRVNVLKLNVALDNLQK